MPLELYPTVDVKDLARRDQARADTIVTFRPDSSGELRPTRIHLLRVLDNASPGGELDGSTSPSGDAPPGSAPLSNSPEPKPSGKPLGAFAP